MSTYRDISPDLIIKKQTKRIKDKDVELEAGTKLTEMIMILYLLKKHKNSINMLLRKDFKKLFTKINTNKMSINDIQGADYLTQVHIDPITNIPTYIFWPFRNKKMDQFFWSLINPKHPRSKNRFTFMLMSIFSQGDDFMDKKPWGHMNFMVYDKEENKIYRFEPNGGVVNFYDSSALDKMLAKKFKSWGNIDYQTMNDFCFIPASGKKTRGPQALEEKSEEQKTDPGGFCAYWSIFFIDFIMTNHKREAFKDHNISDFLNDMMNDINKKFGSYKGFIRTFAVFINNAARNIGKNKDIDAYIDKMIKEL